MISQNAHQIKAHLSVAVLNRGVVFLHKYSLHELHCLKRRKFINRSLIARKICHLEIGEPLNFPPTASSTRNRPLLEDLDRYQCTNEWELQMQLCYSHVVLIVQVLQFKNNFHARMHRRKLFETKQATIIKRNN